MLFEAPYFHTFELLTFTVPLFIQQFKDKLLREKKLFRHLQEKLSNDMRSYWLPRYYAHLSRSKLSLHLTYRIQGVLFSCSKLSC